MKLPSLFSFFLLFLPVPWQKKKKTVHIHNMYKQTKPCMEREKNRPDEIPCEFFPPFSSAWLAIKKFFLSLSVFEDGSYSSDIHALHHGWSIAKNEYWIKQQVRNTESSETKQKKT